jgi:tRNA pseudouridine38-40 synthase
MRNLRLKIAYDGTDFHGWQRQPREPTIQGCIEQALAEILGEKASLTASGRTDAGVHAAGQVANFKTECKIGPDNLRRALNGKLPQTVRILSVREMPLGFHARFSARSKTYRYRLLLATVCPPVFARFVHHYPYALERSRMEEAASLLVGTHDFTSFVAADALEPGDDEAPTGHNGSDAVRSVFSSWIFWRPRTSLLIYEVRAGGFLRYMVRNIVGTLIEVGRGKIEPKQILTILEARNRTLAGPTAPARGLWLLRVEY